MTTLCCPYCDGVRSVSGQRCVCMPRLNAPQRPAPLSPPAAPTLLERLFLKLFGIGTGS